MQPEFVQTSMGIIGSLGFALLFGIRGTKPLGCIALGSGISWLDGLMNFIATVYTRLFQLLAVPTIALAVIYLEYIASLS